MHEKTNNLEFLPGLTQTRLYSHRSRLEAWNFRFKKKRDYTICEAKTKSLINCAVTAQLICGFVCAYANLWFSHAKDQIKVLSSFPTQVFKGNTRGGKLSTLFVMIRHWLKLTETFHVAVIVPLWMSKHMSYIVRIPVYRCPTSSDIKRPALLYIFQ